MRRTRGRRSGRSAGAPAASRPSTWGTIAPTSWCSRVARRPTWWRSGSNGALRRGPPTIFATRRRSTIFCRRSLPCAGPSRPLLAAAPRAERWWRAEARRVSSSLALLDREGGRSAPGGADPGDRVLQDVHPLLEQRPFDVERRLEADEPRDAVVDVVEAVIQAVQVDLGGGLVVLVA